MAGRGHAASGRHNPGHRRDQPPILIDGLNWSQDLSHLLQYLPADPLHQLIADYHNYMSAGSKNTPAYWDSVIAPIASQMPVMTSEFGEKDCGTTDVTQYMQWADQHGVSYIPWVWMTWPCSGMGLVADWGGTPSAYGRAFYDHFKPLVSAPRQARGRAPPPPQTETHVDHLNPGRLQCDVFARSF